LTLSKGNNSAITGQSLLIIERIQTLVVIYTVSKMVSYVIKDR